MLLINISDSNFFSFPSSDFFFSLPNKVLWHERNNEALLCFWLMLRVIDYCKWTWKSIVIDCCNNSTRTKWSLANFDALSDSQFSHFRVREFLIELHEMKLSFENWQRDSRENVLSHSFMWASIRETLMIFHKKAVILWINGINHTLL